MANILVYGNSIGQGYYDKKGGWVDRLKRCFLEQEIVKSWEQSVNVFNLALSGDITTNILNRIRKETPQRIWAGHEVIFIFQIGLNDTIIINGKPKVSEIRFRNNLYVLFQYCKKYTNKIIFLGLTQVEEKKVTPMPWSPKEYYFNERIKRYNEILKTFCNENKIGYIEMFDLFNKSNYKSYLYDGVHPNTEGREKIFKVVKIFLEERRYING